MLCGNGEGEGGVEVNVVEDEEVEEDDRAVSTGAAILVPFASTSEAPWP